MAHKEEHRLIKEIYGGLPIPTGSYSSEHVAEGRGPSVCVKQGYAAFKEGYEAATKKLAEKIRPLLKASKPRHLELEWHYVIDSVENPWGDFGYHIWRIYE